MAPKGVTFFVSSHKIDFTTLKPRWKVVSTSSTTSVNIPAGYRTYRITFFGYKPANKWGIFSTTRKTGNSYLYAQGMRNGSWFTEEMTRGSNEKEIFIGAVGDIPAGYEFVSMTLARETTSSDIFMALHDVSFRGSLSYHTGRSEFGITSPTTAWTITTDASSGRWIVEAFEE